MNFGKAFVHHKNLLVRGQIETGIVKGLVYDGILGSVFLKSFFDISAVSIAYIVAVCAILTATIQYTYGRFYDNKKMIDIENDWVTDRTPILQELIKK